MGSQYLRKHTFESDLSPMAATCGVAHPTQTVVADRLVGPAWLLMRGGLSIDKFYLTGGKSLGKVLLDIR